MNHFFLMVDSHSQERASSGPENFQISWTFIWSQWLKIMKLLIRSQSAEGRKTKTKNHQSQFCSCTVTLRNLSKASLHSYPAFVTSSAWISLTTETTVNQKSRVSSSLHSSLGTFLFILREVNFLQRRLLVFLLLKTSVQTNRLNWS